MMPAMRATASASPLGSVPSRSSATTSLLTTTRPAAVAVRTLTSFAETSTMCAAPRSSRWVNSLIGPPLRAPPADSGPGHAASCLPPFEQHDGHRRTCLQGCHLLGDHDEGVGVCERGDQVRAASADRGHGIGAALDAEPGTGE